VWHNNVVSTPQLSPETKHESNFSMGQFGDVFQNVNMIFYPQNYYGYYYEGDYNKLKNYAVLYNGPHSIDGSPTNIEIDTRIRDKILYVQLYWEANGNDSVLHLRVYPKTKKYYISYIRLHGNARLFGIDYGTFKNPKHLYAFNLNERKRARITTEECKEKLKNKIRQMQKTRRAKPKKPKKHIKR
jgi:hypothetical protein